VQQVLEFYDWDKFHNFPVSFETLEETELFQVISDEEFTFYTSPVLHYVPAVGVRIEFSESGKVFAYSGDTAPVPSMLGLARDADVLVHEAAGEQAQGHSSARQAAEVARDANVKALYLIHYPVGGFPYHTLIEEAKEVYDGPVVMAEDYDELEF
jgi:ribonuclease Z